MLRLTRARESLQYFLSEVSDAITVVANSHEDRILWVFAPEDLDLDVPKTWEAYQVGLVRVKI